MQLMTKKQWFTALGISAAFVFAPAIPRLVPGQAPAQSTVPDTTSTVERVIDGDTIVVLMNGRDTTIRLIGLDTPETVDPRKPVQCFARAASDKAKSMLTPGMTIRLETDPSQGTTDKYGRTLAYVFVPCENQILTQCKILFNEYMIAQGYGHEYTFDLPYKYQVQFKAAETNAREAKRGLWSPSTCNGDTDQPAK